MATVESWRLRQLIQQMASGTCLDQGHIEEPLFDVTTFDIKPLILQPSSEHLTMVHRMNIKLGPIDAPYLTRYKSAPTFPKELVLALSKPVTLNPSLIILAPQDESDTEETPATKKRRRQRRKKFTPDGRKNNKRKCSLGAAKRSKRARS